MSANRPGDPGQPTRATWTWDLGSNRIEVSKGYVRLLGTEPPTVHRPFHLIGRLSVEDRERMLDAAFSTIAGVYAPAVEFTWTLPDGQSRILVSKARLIRGDDSTPGSMRGALEDVTDERLAWHAARERIRSNNGRMAVAIAGSDRLARLGLQTLLTPFPAVEVVAELAPFLPADDPAWAVTWPHIDAVLLDVDRDAPAYRDFVQQVRRQSPMACIVAVLHPTVLDTVAHLSHLGIDRCVTSEVPGEFLISVLMELFASRWSGPVAHAPPPVPEPLSVGEPFASSGPTVLTDAEYRTLRMLTSGMRNSEIAAALFVSEPTVKRYTQRIYRKLGARDRAHAAAIASRLGLV